MAAENESSTDPDPEPDQTLDARTIDGEPFGAIMAALEQLNAEESLLLINSFEPEPLYSVLEQRGFTYDSARVDDDEWHVRIEPA